MKNKIILFNLKTKHNFLTCNVTFFNKICYITSKIITKHLMLVFNAYFFNTSIVRPACKSHFV